MYVLLAGLPQKTKNHCENTPRTTTDSNTRETITTCTLGSFLKLRHIQFVRITNKAAMDLLNSYGSDSDADKEITDSGTANHKGRTPQNSSSIEEDAVFIRKPPLRGICNPAPLVSLTAGRTSNALTVSGQLDDSAAANKRKQGELILMNNPTKAVMYQPVQGPQCLDPSSRNSIKNAAGEMQANVAFDEMAFAEQRAAFQRSGQALAPTDEGNIVLRTTLGYDRARLEKFTAVEEERRKRPRPNPREKQILVQGSDDEAEYGVWGPPTQEERWQAENSLSDLAKGGIDGLAPEQLAERAYLQERDRQRGIEDENKEEESAFDRLIERKMAHLLPPKISTDTPMDSTTTFHGKEEFDYKGLSWISPPAGLGALVADGQLEIDHHRCFVPKKCVHRFTGHNKGVHRIRLFPQTGHLILSAGLDGKCKVWSVEQKQVMRTYIGHSAAVRDVQFNHDGTRFISASFDRYLRLWDTESGKVLQTFTNRKVPYVVQFYPHDDNLFVVGCSDNKIVTYDATTAEVTQEYNHHLAPVNSILFVEDHGTKMVTTSDDKKVLVWEWDIGVPIKYISDPSMQSIPSTTLHPSHQYFCGQSLDNTIVVFQANNRFALQRKKKFSGHVVSGYACEIAFSPDGQFLVSGDGNGSVFVWDWKKHKILQKFRAHSSGPAICCVWHPLEPTTLFTCGWDGLIKMWQ